MEKVIKTCKKHGELVASQVYAYKKVDENGKEYVKQLFCRKCKLESSVKWQQSRPDKIKEYAIKHKDKIKKRLKETKYYKANVQRLTVGYVKNVLHAIYKVPFNEIPEKAIIIKRKALKLRREGFDVREYVKKLDKIFGRTKKYGDK